MRSSRTKVQTYHEDSSSQDESTDIRNSRRTSLSLRSRSTTRMPRSYREESTEASFDEAVENLESESPVTPPTQAPEPDSGSVPTPRPSRRAARTQKPRRAKPSSKSRSQVGRPLHKRAKTDTSDPIFLGSGVIPPWQTLPYHILLDIFLRASHPLLDEGRSARNDSVKWLVTVALLCRSFQEPALAALYYCPPLLPAYKSHALLHLLAQPQQSLSMNYSSKIKQLHVEVEPVLIYKSGPTLGYFDLSQLIEKTPQVHTIRLYHKDDYTVGIPPWQFVQSKWTYPSHIFSAIEDRGITLRSWDWNSRFLETGKLVEMMVKTHSQRAFRTLKELKLLHLDDPDQETSAIKEAGLLEALDTLPDLERLEFIESSLVSGDILINLPHTLRSLTLNNCDRLWSSDLTAYLSSHGANIRELSLSHNRHLNMSFIQTLAQSCENLEIFKMDLSMHDGSSYHDVEPHFKDLLVQSEVPTWPLKLQEIELTQLRKWDDATAEVFFTSLVNAAPQLRDLRRLAISAILKIGWRDRATFRERWIGQLERVFLRQSKPPDPSLRSLRKRPLISNTGTTGNRPDDLEAQVDKSSPVTARGVQSTTFKRQSTRLAHQKPSEGDDAASGASLAGSPQPQAGKIQGMCDIVNIRIDNQRPTELQFNENDFLDDELSGDEDWDGDDF